MIAVAILALVAANTLRAQGAAVTCKDGSSSVAGRGACSGHGGVAKATKAAPAAAAKTAAAPTKTAATAPAVDPKAAAKAAAAEKKAAKASARAEAKAAKADAPAPRPTPAAPRTSASVPAPTPAPARAPATRAAPRAEGTPIATCKDGSTSYAKTHSGACSRHGGVQTWLDGTARKP
jgi:hypothetical protein